MDLERKALPFELKADNAGEFRAVFATLNVIDRDGDVTVPGAFKDGTNVIVGSWGHRTRELPVGKGVIRAGDPEVAVEGEFFLDTEAGKDTYQTVKNLGDLGEWSYVFRVVKESFGEFEGRQVRFLEDLEVFSVDPVLAGAGIDTRTTNIKSSRDMTFEEHVAAFAKSLEEFTSRVESRAAVRAKEGRTFSQSNVEALMPIAESVIASGRSLEKLVADTAPKSASEALAREFVRWQALQHAHA